MKEYFANKAIGFYLVVVAAILSLVGIITYNSVLYRLTPVFVLMVVAIVLAVVVMVLLAMKKKGIAGFLTVVNAVLMMSAAAWSAKVMVNQIAYVVTGLDPFSTIKPYVIYLVIAILASVVNMVASFMKLEKNK